MCCGDQIDYIPWNACHSGTNFIFYYIKLYNTIFGEIRCCGDQIDYIPWAACHSGTNFILYYIILNYIILYLVRSGAVVIK